MDPTDVGFRRIPAATVERLPIYLRSLLDFTESGITTVSSERLAAATGVNAAKVRKDLSYLGSYGTRGVGYDVDYLVYQIQLGLGMNQIWRVGLAGIGNLGHALVNYKGFIDRRFRIEALFDADPSKVGTDVGGLTINSTDAIEDAVRDQKLTIGLIATPAHAAQDIADRFVAGGVVGILNFAPTVLQIPDDVMLRKVDLSIEMQILAFYVARSQGLVGEDVEFPVTGLI